LFRLIIALCLAQLTLYAPASLSTSQVGRSEPRRPYGVPEASLPCTPEEQEWWNELRSSADEMKPSREPGSKQKKRYATLLHDGQAKGFKPPIADTRALILFRSFPSYTEDARRRSISGAISLQLELLPDGNVGDVKVIQPLDPGLDENAMAAARKTIFLPAVKNREFVSSSIRMVMSFNVF
jgi:TonB family protein